MREINQALLHKLLDYNPDTGAFIWRQREAGWFKKQEQVSQFNTVYAGRQAGAVNSIGYRVIRVEGRLFSAHRLAWLYCYGEWPKNIIDHLNGDKADNRIANLRDVTRLENQRNQRRKGITQSGVVGVNWCRERRKWAVRIGGGGMTRNLGRFDSLEEAKEVRRRAEIEYGYAPNHGRAPQ